MRGEVGEDWRRKVMKLSSMERLVCQTDERRTRKIDVAKDETGKDRKMGQSCQEDAVREGRR